MTSPIRHIPVAWLALLALFAMTTLVALAGPVGVTRYVSPSGNNLSGANPCTDPVAPCATLSHALRQAGDGDLIRLANGTYAESELTLSRPIAVVGDGDATVLNGQSGQTILTVKAEVSIEGVTLRGGGGRRGGAIAVEGDGRLTLRRMVVESNRADWGGGMYIDGGTVRIEDSRLVDNAAGSGGAIFVAAGDLAITGVTLRGNRAAMGGGLFVGPAARVTMERSVVEDNQANQLGGGVHIQGQFHAVNALWRNNRAGARGGGLFSDDGTVAVSHTAWLGNSAVLGGAVGGDGSLRLTNSFMTASAGDDCAATLTGANNLLDDASCGLPARPITGLDADGRPTGESNALDAVPPGQCAGPSGSSTLNDLRGEPRPTDADRNGSPACDIGPFEFQPRITIVHDASPAEATSFEFGGDLGTYTLSSAVRPWRTFEVAPGSYRLQEGRKPGWKVTAVACSGDGDGGSQVDVKTRTTVIDLDAGEAITCTFTSRANRNSIGIAVESTDGAVAVPFSGDVGVFELRLPDRPDRRGGKMAAGVYNVQATPPTGWRVTSIACEGDRDGGSSFDPANGLARIDLDARETLSCVFRVARLSRTGTLTIRHAAAPAEDAGFTYTGDLGPFTLRTPSLPEVSFARPPGVVRVHELLHPLWSLNGIDCAGDSDGGTTVILEEATAWIDLDAGENITCVFRHSREAAPAGTITVLQRVTPAEAVTFAYNGGLGSFELSLPNATTRTWAALATGSYVIRQATPAAWPLDSIICEGDTDGGSALDPADASATIDLDDGETIVCTFANTRRAGRGNLTILHEPSPADETDFRYDGVQGGFTLRAPSQPRQSFSGLEAGVYVVRLTMPQGWLLTEIVCEGDHDAGNVIDIFAGQATIDLDGGESITCRFRPARNATPPPEQWRLFLPFAQR